VVIRQPTPRLAADEDPGTEERIKNPPAQLEWIPPERDSIWPPAIAVTHNRIPPAVRVKVPKSRGVVVTAYILLRCCQRSLPCLNPPRCPLIELVLVGRSVHRNGLWIGRPHRKALSFPNGCRLSFA